MFPCTSATYLCVLKGGHSLNENGKDMLLEVVRLHATAMLTRLVLCKKASVGTGQSFRKAAKQSPKVNPSSDLEGEGRRSQHSYVQHRQRKPPESSEKWEKHKLFESDTRSPQTHLLRLTCLLRLLLKFRKELHVNFFVKKIVI